MRGLAHTWNRVKARVGATMAAHGITCIPLWSLKGMLYRVLVCLGKETQGPSSKFFSLVWKRGHVNREAGLQGATTIVEMTLA